MAKAKKKTSPAQGSGPRTIQCYHCSNRFQISARAMTLSCPQCSKSLLVDDVTIKDAHGVTKLQTCGKIIIEKRGRLIADLVEAHMGIDVRGGIVDAKTVRSGPVHIASKSRWKGDCQAQQVIIEKGVKLIDGHFDFPNNELGLDSLHPENRHRLAPAPPEDAQDTTKIAATTAPPAKKKTSKKAVATDPTLEKPVRDAPANTVTKKTKKKKSSTAKKKKTATTRRKPSS